MADLEDGLKLVRNLTLPIEEQKPQSEAALLSKYAELKVLSQFLETFDLSAF